MSNHAHYCLAVLTMVAVLFGLQWVARKPAREVRSALLKFLKRQR